MTRKEGWIETRFCDDCAANKPHQMCNGTSYAGGAEEIHSHCLGCGTEKTI